MLSSIAQETPTTIMTPLLLPSSLWHHAASSPGFLSVAAAIV